MTNVSATGGGAVPIASSLGMNLWQWAHQAQPVVAQAVEACRAGRGLTTLQHDLVRIGEQLREIRLGGLGQADQGVLGQFSQNAGEVAAGTGSFSIQNLEAVLRVIGTINAATIPPGGTNRRLADLAVGDRFPTDQRPGVDFAVPYDSTLPPWAQGTTSVGGAVITVVGEKIREALGYTDRPPLTFSNSGLIRLLGTRYVALPEAPVLSVTALQEGMALARPDKRAKAVAFAEGQIAQLDPKTRKDLESTGRKLAGQQLAHQEAFQRVMATLEETGVLKGLADAGRHRADTLKDLNLALLESPYLKSRGISPAAYRILAYQRRATQAPTNAARRYWTRKALLLEKAHIVRHYRTMVTALKEMGRPEGERDPYDTRAKKAEEIMDRAVDALYTPDEWAILRKANDEFGSSIPDPESFGWTPLPEAPPQLSDMDRRWIETFRQEVLPFSIEWDARGLEPVLEAERVYERARLAHGQATRNLHRELGFAAHEWTKVERETNLIADEADYRLQKKRLGRIWAKLEAMRRDGTITEAQAREFDRDRTIFLHMMKEYRKKHKKHMEYMEGFFDGSDVSARVHEHSSKDKGDVTSLFELQLFLEAVYLKYGLEGSPAAISLRSVVATGHVERALHEESPSPHALNNFFASVASAGGVVADAVGYKIGPVKLGGPKSPNPEEISVMAAVHFAGRVAKGSQVGNTYFGLGDYHPLFAKKPPHPLATHLEGASHTFPRELADVSDELWVEPGAWDMSHNGIDEFRAIVGGMEPEGMTWFTGAQAGAVQVFIVGDVIMATTGFGKVERSKGSAGIYDPWRDSVESDSGVSFFGEGARRSRPATAHPLGDFHWDPNLSLAENLAGQLLPMAPGIRATSGMNHKLMSMVFSAGREAGLFSMDGGVLSAGSMGVFAMHDDVSAIDTADDIIVTHFASGFAEDMFEPSWPLDEIKDSGQAARLLARYFSRYVGLNFAVSADRRVGVVPPISSLGLLETDELVAEATRRKSDLFAPEEGAPLTARERYLRTIQFHVNAWRFLELYYKTLMDTTPVPPPNVEQQSLLRMTEGMEEAEMDEQLRDGLTRAFIERAKKSPLWGRVLPSEPLPLRPATTFAANDPILTREDSARVVGEVFP